MANPPKPDLASAMYPNLSKAARERAAQQARQDAELRERSKRTAAHLDEVIAAIRREREGR
jgi:hypothetical protein